MRSTHKKKTKNSSAFSFIRARAGAPAFFFFSPFLFVCIIVLLPSANMMNLRVALLLLLPLLLLPFVSSSSPSSDDCMENFPEITLHYWNGRGLMEVSRVMLALRGLFPGEGYEDARWMGGLPSVEEGEVPTQNPRPYQDVDRFVPVDVNAGRLPILVAKENNEQIAVGQSLAIWWYVAEKLNFLGEVAFHQPQILSILETLKEVKDSYRKLTPYGQEPTEENQKMWFEEGADDYSGRANTPRRNERFLKFWMGRLENQIPGTQQGFSVGNQITLADIAIHNCFCEFLDEKDAAEGVSVSKREPFGDLAKTKALVAEHPKINAICENIINNKGFQKWLSVRGTQSF